MGGVRGAIHKDHREYRRPGSKLRRVRPREQDGRLRLRLRRACVVLRRLLDALPQELVPRGGGHRGHHPLPPTPRSGATPVREDEESYPQRDAVRGIEEEGYPEQNEEAVPHDFRA